MTGVGYLKNDVLWTQAAWTVMIAAGAALTDEAGAPQHKIS